MVAGAYINLLAQSVRVVEDLPYFEGPQATEKHRLDLYLPQSAEPAPLLLWIHGGAWAFGERKREKALAEKFAAEGIAVAAVSYRLSPGTWADPKFNTGIRHPEHIKDIARAFQWLHEQATTYGYSANNIFVSGYSAGGHLSALLATDGRYLKDLGLSTANIKGIIPIAGAYDISDYHKAHYSGNGPEMAEKHVKAVFGDTEEDFADASPTEFVAQLKCPILLISERQSYSYTIIFEKALRASNAGNAEYLHVHELDHKGLYEDLAQKANSKYRIRIIAFIKKWSIQPVKSHN